MPLEAPLLVEQRRTSQGTGFLALSITVQVLIVAVAALGGLWLVPGLASAFGLAFASLNGDPVPEPAVVNRIIDFWATWVVGLATLLLIAVILLRWSRMVMAAIIWSAVITVLAVLSSLTFGVHWKALAIVLSALVLVFAVRDLSTRAA